MDSGSIGGGRSVDEAVNDKGDSAGQAASLSSLEEIQPGLAKRARRKPTLDRQHSDSSGWMVGAEDGNSERVRFDDHVSFIEAREDPGNCRGLQGRRKRNKEGEAEGDVRPR